MNQILYLKNLYWLACLEYLILLCIYILINSKFLGRGKERCETCDKINDVPREGRITWCG